MSLQVCWVCKNRRQRQDQNCVPTILLPQLPIVDLKTYCSMLRILVTAGPTREYLDPVRCLTNDSSGKLGYAIAAAARERGHTSTLLTGPVVLEAPPRVKVVPFVSAADLQKLLKSYFRVCDALVMTAAVADYRPTRKFSGKIRRQQGRMQLQLVPTPDILASVAEKKTDQVVVAFALELRKSIRNAMGKLRSKNADLLVLNGAENLKSDHAAVTLLWPEGHQRKIARASKRMVAKKLIREIERLAAKKGVSRKKTRGE